MTESIPLRNLCVVRFVFGVYITNRKTDCKRMEKKAGNIRHFKIKSGTSLKAGLFVPKILLLYNYYAG